MAEELRKGDKVRWNSHGGEAVGDLASRGFPLAYPVRNPIQHGYVWVGLCTARG
jgi:hypothetical protein